MKLHFPITTFNPLLSRELHLEGSTNTTNASWSFTFPSWDRRVHTEQSQPQLCSTGNLLLLHFCFIWWLNTFNHVAETAMVTVTLLSHHILSSCDVAVGLTLACSESNVQFETLTLTQPHTSRALVQVQQSYRLNAVKTVSHIIHALSLANL